MGAHAAQLDPTLRSVESRDFEAGLRRKIVGQDEAVQAVVDLYQVFRAGLNSPGRPVGNYFSSDRPGPERPAWSKRQPKSFLAIRAR
jgi:hypothetical protein